MKKLVNCYPASFNQFLLVLPLFLLTQLLGCQSESSSEPTGFTQNISLQAKSNHIKALFFGRGPYSKPGSLGCSSTNTRWQSFPYGSSVEVIIPAGASNEDTLFVIEEIEKLNTAIAGYFTISVVQSNDIQLAPANKNQITINLLNAQQMQQICLTSGGGCSTTDLRDDQYTIIKGDTYYPTGRGIFDMHEIGHTIGLCHVDVKVFPEGTMASESGTTIRRFSQSELDAINSVFTSGLNVGASEQEFWDAGLLP